MTKEGLKRLAPDVPPSVSIRRPHLDKKFVNHDAFKSSSGHPTQTSGCTNRNKVWDRDGYQRIWHPLSLPDFRPASSYFFTKLGDFTVLLNVWPSDCPLARDDHLGGAWVPCRAAPLCQASPSRKER